MDDKTALAHVKRLYRQSRGTTNRLHQAARPVRGLIPPRVRRAKAEKIFFEQMLQVVRRVDMPGVICPPVFYPRHRMPDEADPTIQTIYLEPLESGFGFGVIVNDITWEAMDVQQSELTLSSHGLQRLLQRNGTPAMRPLRERVWRTFQGLRAALEDDYTDIDEHTESIEWIDKENGNDTYCYKRHSDAGKGENIWILTTLLRGEALSQRRRREIAEHARQREIYNAVASNTNNM